MTAPSSRSSRHLHTHLARALVFVGALAPAAACGGASTPARTADGPSGTAGPPAPEPPGSRPGAAAAPGAPREATSPTAVAAEPGAPAVPEVVVEAPPFAHATRRRVKGTAVDGRTVLRLKKVSERPNGITDEEAWFAAHGVTLPARGLRGAGHAGAAPERVAAAFRGQPLLAVLDTADEGRLALYGDLADGARWVVILGDDDRPRTALDFAAFGRAPVVADDEGFIHQGVRWAVLSKGVLYVSSFHRTYAKSSGGANGFLTAVDPATGAIRWQSEPLVANAANFLLWDGFIVTGYGFTAEPDHVFVVDQATGATLAKTPVKSGPSFLVRKGDQLLVRTYDTDLAFDVE